MKIYPFVFLLSFLAFISCKDDLCKNVVCLNGATCENGDCFCADGFSGEFCSVQIDSCMNLCENGGICNKGNCDCPPGYVGQYCETPDPCYGVFCSNAFCYQGDCICSPGYEGLSCETTWSARFVGTFASVTSTCGPSYPAEINATSPMLIQLSNLGNYPSDAPYFVEAVLSGSLNFSITDTSGIYLNTPDYYAFEGSGSYDLDTKELTVNYVCNYASQSDTCTATFSYP